MIRLFLFALLATLCGQLLAGCTSTVTPKIVAPTQASYDGNAQNSGLLTLNAKGATVTPTARARYNGLVALYGKAFLPAIPPDYGVTANADGTFQMTDEALQDFIVMSTWHRMGKEAAK